MYTKIICLQSMPNESTSVGIWPLSQEFSSLILVRVELKALEQHATGCFRMF